MCDSYIISFPPDWLDNCCWCGYWTKRWNQLQSWAWIACEYMSLERFQIECCKTKLVMSTCQPLTSLAAKYVKLYACGNNLSPTFVPKALLVLTQLIIIVHLADTQCGIAFCYTSDWMKGGGGGKSFLSLLCSVVMHS